MRGKRVICKSLLSVFVAHPRACGENAWWSQEQYEEGGSSPRMRGKQELRGRKRVSGRLIPAHAGKTPKPSPPTSTPTAHPRACGENPHAGYRPKIAHGSSPRMRGKRICSNPNRFSNRLIPAHAGKTEDEYSFFGWGGAHPRACGENAIGGIIRF